MFKKCDIAGSVILYNSEEHVINNILSYVSQLDHLYIIDNSETMNPDLLKEIKKISNTTYIFNGSNLGVAYALNQAATIAVNTGYQFLLTMDDDTVFPENGIQIMLNYIAQYGTEKLGILASQSNEHLFNNSVNQVPFTITSGNLLNLSAYKICGRFMDELFIDCVDHEYCFRLRNYGYEIIEMNAVHLKHKLGSKKQLKVLDYRLPFCWISHNPLRIYYKTRNSLFFLKTYSFIGLKIRYIFYKEIIKDLSKIIFLEDNKKIRIVLYYKGICDGLGNNLGKKMLKF